MHTRNTAALLPDSLTDLGRFQNLWQQHNPGTVTPYRPNEWQAATAIVVAPDLHQQLHFSVIKRVQRDGDPWSGQMALPGGKRDRDDANLAMTARRETYEELGLALDDALGGLPASRRKSAPGTLATYIFTLEHMPPLTPEPGEVAAAWWCPVTHLIDPSCRIRYRSRPAIAFADEPIWGLTYRTLVTFAATHGITLPDD
jgi:8-oxo-dGTP pyrophosphatase MutT (NUDIX family)